MSNTLGTGAAIFIDEPHIPEWLDCGPVEPNELDAQWTSEVIRGCSRARPVLELRNRGLRQEARILRAPLAERDQAIYLALDSQRWSEGRSWARFELYGVVFLMESRLRFVDEHTAVCTKPRLFCFERRRAARQPIEPGCAELEWRYLDGEELRSGRAEVYDLTPECVGVVPRETSVPLPGRRFSASLRVRDKVIACIAQTRPAIGMARAAVAIDIQAGRHHELLLSAYLGEHLPSLVDRRSVDVQALHRLMDESGYLALRSSSAEFAAWTQLSLPELPSVDRVYRAADGALIGNVSITQVYRHTWLWHQLACLPGHAESGEARLQLYLLGPIVPALHHGVEAKGLAYFNQEHRWHRMFFSQFVDWINDRNLANICSFDRFERDLPPDEAPLPEPYELRTASERDLLQIATLVRAQLPEITADAMDIHPAELRKLELQARGREVFALVLHGEVVAAALCEFGDQNVSLFNLLNMVQIYTRSGRHKPPAHAVRALLARARAFYRARGVVAPMMVAPAGTLDHDIEPGTSCVECMGCVVVAGRGLRQFENFCRFHFCRRWRRDTPMPAQEPSNVSGGCHA